MPSTQGAMDEIRKRFDQLEHKGISVKACIAELIGTATFVLLGCSVAIFTGHYQTGPLHTDVMTNTLLVALAFGLSIGISISMIVHHSGGHVNPAVTLGMLASGMISLAQSIGHMVSQCLGAILAALLLHALIPHDVLKGSHMGANVLPKHSHPIHAFFAEVVGMFICELVILEICCNKKSKVKAHAPLVIGLTFFLAIFAIGPISSGSLNPARSLGPAIVGLYFRHLWIYLTAPFCGALLAAPVHLFYITDIDTITHHTERAVEEGTVEPLLPNTAAA